MELCLIAAGANLGDRQANLDAAIAALTSNPQIQIVAVSSFHETKPVGGPEGQGDFLNAAIQLKTSLMPAELLETLLSIETTLGRTRSTHWGPRSIDLDLLLYGTQIIDEENLKVPHPWMHLRRFVLSPAAEIAGEMVHAQRHRTVNQLLAELDVSACDAVTSL
jgi:2-amino-4-hydroxy-6-hydroxymethyldihydropteridine diphosphokinase